MGLQIEQYKNIILNGKVPALTVAFCIISVVLVFALAIGMFFFLKKKYNCEAKAYFAGVLAWFVFASLLESLVHQIVLSGGIGQTIMSSPLYYSLYGGIMAGLFEETGRLVLMKFFLKDCFGNDKNAIMYGAGHGCFEAVYILGFGMISNIIIALQINSGAIAVQFASLETLTESQAVTALSTMASMITSPSYMFSLGIFERILAIVIHISISVLVWFAVKRNNMLLFIEALLLHAFVDGSMSYINMKTGSIAITLAYVALMSALLAVLAVLSYRENSEKKLV